MSDRIEVVMWNSKGKRVAVGHLEDDGMPPTELVVQQPEQKPRTFGLTDPLAAGTAYALGRRRFHYVEDCSCGVCTRG